MNNPDHNCLEQARKSGWYDFTIIVDQPRDEHYLLDLGMPDIPGHLGHIHLPKANSEGVIEAIIWLRSSSRYLRLIEPSGETAIPFKQMRSRRLNSFSAFVNLLMKTHRLADHNPNLRLVNTSRKNGARLRKKGFHGMLTGAYKDYYRAYLHAPTSAAPTPSDDYTHWVNRYDSTDDVKIQRWHGIARKLVDGPLISVIMPVYNPAPEHLKAALASVTQQIYENWELCIADDASTNPEIHQILEASTQHDPRITLTRLPKNSGIADATNAALELAKGDWITFLDHDDLLREQSLLRIAETLRAHPHIRFLYTDEDKISDAGERQQPHFKPDWNPELLRAVNYLCHLSVYDRQLVQETGNLRQGLDGAQDYDFVLRATAQLQEHEIHHLPEILYHWRLAKGSTAGGADNKSYAAKAGEKALTDAMCSTTPGCSITAGEYPTTYRVDYPIPNPQPLVSIIIPTRNAGQLVEQCINSIIKKTTYSNYEILIVDNGSTDKASIDYFRMLDQESVARILPLDIPFNYSRLNNFGVARAQGDVVVLLNNDVEIISDNWLSEMVSLASRPGTGAVGAKLYYSDGKIQHGGVILGIGGVAGHAHKYFDRHASGYFGRLKHRQNLSAVTAACLTVRKSIYEELGGLDEENLTVAFNDVDFCLRLLDAGYTNIWTPYAKLYHHESISRGAEDTREKQERFTREVRFMQKKWGTRLTTDPAYNPNLTLEHENFSLAFPPRRAATDTASNIIEKQLSAQPG